MSGGKEERRADERRRASASPLQVGVRVRRRVMDLVVLVLARGLQGLEPELRLFTANDVLSLKEPDLRRVSACLLLQDLHCLPRMSRSCVGRAQGSCRSTGSHPSCPPQARLTG